MTGEHKSKKVKDQTYLFLDDNFFIIMNSVINELWHLCPRYIHPDKGRRVVRGRCKRCYKMTSKIVLTQYALLGGEAT